MRTAFQVRVQRNFAGFGVFGFNAVNVVGLQLTGWDVKCCVNTVHAHSLAGEGSAN
jgi:hypothetical protein